jgi:hypothetical protein
MKTWKKYYGVNGLGMRTARTYATEDEARAAILRKTKRHVAAIKGSRPLPTIWVAETK